jgi:hypothetical protein
MRSILSLLLVFAGSLPIQAGPSPILPDPSLTPGAVFDVTAADLAVPGYCKKVRNVPQSVKEQVYAEYGIAHRDPGEYEVDHLISLELGGNNSIHNLWPESFLTEPWNAHVKDRLENRLHELVVAGKIDLKTAQREIASDWIAAYKKYVGPEPPHGKQLGTAANRHDHAPAKSDALAKGSAVQQVPTQTGTNTSDLQSGTPVRLGPPDRLGPQVWVNTKSGVIWQQGTPYYGNTKHGEYMSESEALARGYHFPGK